jgi:FMN phosphatase YigB (HAD superfamily)
MSLTLNCSVARLLERRVVILDLDNNLLPTNDAFADYSEALARSLLQDAVFRDKALTESELRSALELTRTQLNSIFFARRLDKIAALVAAYPGRDVNLLFAAASKEAEGAYRKRMQLSPEIRAVLARLKLRQRRLIAYTGGSPNYTIGNLEIADLAKYFSRVYCGASHPWEDSSQSRMTRVSAPGRNLLFEMAPKAKKSGVGFQTVLEEEKLDGEECWSIGDHPIEDVALAQLFGIYGVLSQWYVRMDIGDVVPDAVFEDPRELLALLS